MLKTVLIYTRRGIKITILSIIAVFLIIGTVAFLFKPTYAVYMNDERIGYTENKSKLQHRINDYIEKGDGTKDCLAFVQLQDTPKYEICLLKKNIEPNDEEIFEKVKENNTPYYRYYAICDNQEEKTYVKDFSEAEDVVNKLREKKSTNSENISISEKYQTDEKEIVTTEEAVSKLYVEPQRPVKVASNRSQSGTKRYKATGSVNTSKNTSYGKANLGISLIQPVSGVITSPYGYRHGSFHTGLDIATSRGSTIKAAAAGTVTFAGWKGSYGNLIVISHGNGVQTYYAHCNSLNASVGQSVSQGQKIATVGSTGNSTGPHLHLEIRVNGTTYNPRNYIY